MDCNIQEDELQCMEEGQCTKSALCRSSSVFDVQKNLLNGRPLHLSLSKDDVAATLLRVVGPAKTSSVVVNDLFDQVDVDRDGLVTAEQLAEFLTCQVESEEQSINRWRFIASKVIRASTGGTFFFVCASTISIQNNLVKRMVGQASIFTTISPPLIMWSSLIGSVLFVWSFLCRSLQELKGQHHKSLQEKIMFLLRRNTASIGPIINYLWLFGSVAYLCKLWLIGGLCYFLGGLLAIPSIYRQLMLQKERQQDTFLEINSFVTTNLSRAFAAPDNIDELSVMSQHTNATHMPVVANKSNTMHRRMSYDSNVTGRPKPFHQRAPTCPVFTNIDLVFKDEEVKDLAEETIGTFDTESMTADATEADSSILGKDISLQEQCFGLSSMNCRGSLECDEIFASFENEKPDLDMFVKVVSQMNLDATTSQSVSPSTSPQIATKVSAYFTAILYTLGGLLFTIGSFENSGLGQDTIQNMSLAASSSYLCASSLILWQAWNAANEEWLRLQSIINDLRHKSSPANGALKKAEAVRPALRPTIAIVGSFRNFYGTFRSQ